jgi:hypothetical protein
MTHPASPESQPAKSSRTVATEAEAARYALLRRLAPSMRHHLVVNLQPIGMIYEVMDRRLRAPQPILAEVHEGAHKINRYARSALNSCIDVITWLAPEEDASTTVVEGARECLELLATNFAFRGFPLRDEVEPVPGRIRRAAVRNVLTGALLHLSDANAAPAQITLSAACVGSEVRVTLSLTPTAGEPGFGAGPTYRPLSWGDVQALAAAEQVQLQRDEREIRISFPCSRGSAA